MQAADQSAQRRPKATKPAASPEVTVWQQRDQQVAATIPTDDGFGAGEPPATEVREWG